MKVLWTWLIVILRKTTLLLLSPVIAIVYGVLEAASPAKANRFMWRVTMGRHYNDDVQE